MSEEIKAIAKALFDTLEETDEWYSAIFARSPQLATFNLDNADEEKSFTRLWAQTAQVLVREVYEAVVVMYKEVEQRNTAS